MSGWPLVFCANLLSALLFSFIRTRFLNEELLFSLSLQLSSRQRSRITGECSLHALAQHDWVTSVGNKTVPSELPFSTLLLSLFYIACWLAPILRGNISCLCGELWNWSTCEGYSSIIASRTDYLRNELDKRIASGTRRPTGERQSLGSVVKFISILAS